MFRKLTIILVGTLFVVPRGNAKENGTPTFTRANKAGPDYVIQGEYDGEVGDGLRFAAHVIATGKGTFKAIGYMGGLPGDGWSREPGQYVTGKLKDGNVGS